MCVFVCLFVRAVKICNGDVLFVSKSVSFLAAGRAVPGRQVLLGSLEEKDPKKMPEGEKLFPSNRTEQKSAAS